MAKKEINPEGEPFAAPDESTAALVASANQDHGQDAAVAMRRDEMELGRIAGDVPSDAIRAPWLKIAYGVGGLSTKFNPGDLVLNGNCKIAARDQKLRVVILSAAFYYKEVLSREARAQKIRPRTFRKAKEAQEAGLTTEWSGPNGARIGPGAREAMDFKLLIEQPGDADPALFGLEFGDTRWTPAQFSVDKSGFERVGRPFLQAASYQLSRVGFDRAAWKLWTESQLLGGNPTIVPMLSLETTLMPEAVTKQMRETFSGIRVVDADLPEDEDEHVD